MGNNIKLKRSAVPGKSPLLTDIAYGEIAINTYDGNIFIKKNNGSESIVKFQSISGNFKTVNVVGTDIISDSIDDVLNITKNNNAIYDNILITPDSVSDSFDISLSDSPKFSKLFLDTNGTISSIKGEISWNSIDETININLGNNVIGQMFQEIHYPLVKNLTGSTIPNGTPVVFLGVDSDNIPYIGKYIADGTYDPTDYWGIATEDILNGAKGRITHFGKVNDLNTEDFNVGDTIYCSASIAGAITNIRPISPNLIIEIGIVLKSHNINGTIQVRRANIFRSFEIPYDNTESELTASNVQSAIDELNLMKADISALSSNIILYRTTTNSDIAPTYRRLVTSIDDPYFDDVAINVSTGPINTLNQLVASYISEPGIFVGNPGIINITTIFNARKTTGNNNQYADFYFTLYKRDSLGNEELVATSNTTGPINPVTLNQYYGYTASAILNNGTWLETDRIVIKSWGNSLGSVPGAVYDFEFGGDNPMRNLLPVPVSVIPTNNASGILVNTEDFSRVLSGLDDDVQTALETIDSKVALKTITITASSGLTSSGSSDLSGNIIFSHGDTSSVSNIVQSSRYYIDGLTFDEFGHVTGTSKSIVNNIVTTDNAIARYNGLTGELQNSTVIIDDSGNVGIGTSSIGSKLTVNGDIEINDYSVFDSNSSTTSTISDTVIDFFNLSIYRTAKYIIQARNTINSEVQTTEILLIHNGLTQYMTEYGLIYSGSSPFITYSSNIVSGNINIIATPNTTNLIEYKIFKTLIKS